MKKAICPYMKDMSCLCEGCRNKKSITLIDFDEMVKELSDTELGTLYGLVDAELRKKGWKKVSE